MTKSSITALFILGTIIITLLFFQTPLMSNIRGTAWNGLIFTVANVFKIGPLEVDHEKIDQMQLLRSNNIRMHAELQDYRRLREQLGTPTFDDFKVVNAAVLSRPIDALRSQYVINKGSNEGITIDAPVVINSSTMIGYITEVTEKTAVVQLLLHPATNLTVESVGNEENSSIGRGLLQSRHYTSLIITTIPRDVNLEINQPIVTVVKENQIPPGLTIGTISKVYNAENEAYQEAWLALPYDPDKIDAVGVLVLP